MDTDLLFPPGATKHDWLIDVSMTLALIVVTVLPYVMTGPTTMWDGSYDVNVWLVTIVSSMLMVGVLVLRRHAPFIAMAGITIGGLLQLLVFSGPTGALVAIPIISYTIARFIPGKAARIVLYIGIFASIAGPTQWIGLSGGQYRVVYIIILAVLCFGVVMTPYAMGRRVRDSADAREQQRLAAEERHQRDLAEREQRVRIAEVDTRNQIARELHDIVAHSLSVMIVQAEGGRALARKHPEAAAASLDVIAETGREALTEMRRIVGVLRTGAADSEPVTYAPAPGLREIPDLVRRTTDRATLAIAGVVPDVPQTMGLTVYRTVQEALTNFLKHAGPDATANVAIRYLPGQIALEVADNGLGTAAPSDGMGNGLRGMEERVAAMGGSAYAGPHPEGGFVVRANLPYQARPPAMRQTNVRPLDNGGRGVGPNSRLPR